MNKLNKTTARLAYRSAWNRYLLLPRGTERNQLEDLMENLQLECVDGPGLEWEEFATSLPGYTEYWEKLEKDMNKIFSEVYGEKL